MIGKEISSERRIYRRYQVTGLVFAMLSLSKQCFKVFNVSMGGLGVRYVGEKGLDKSTEIDILTNKDFHLSKLPITVVSDIEVKSENSLYKMPVRHTGVMFNKITSRHESMLKLLINTYTAGRA